MKGSEVLLAACFFCAALGAGLCQFVMIGLVGLGLFPISFVLLLSAGVLLPGRPAIFRFGGKALGYLFTSWVSCCSSPSQGYASSLVFNATVRTASPATLQWGLLGLSSLTPMIIIPLGLRLQAKWSWNRCVVWGVAAW